ncbi:phage portal protein [Paenibacillus donghaensis]|uniref:Phage portal protein n=1 Tax=Paenibacillus donghaensis TaxID=414771 RepID=A0A2Z2KJZ6_9BACL|nr:phage portal protein [Paenibacillus donghaensis]
MIDYRNRRAVLTEDGHPKKTSTYEEYLIQTALKILNTERFRYVLYGEEVGVERSEWSAWEDVEIKRDMEEALTSHMEIVRAEVRSMEREGQEMQLSILITGLAGQAELEETISV